MRARQPLPSIWLVSDLRNDAAIEGALKRLPRGSGLVFRHHHLSGAARRARFAALLRIARARGHVTVLAGSAAQARRWGADGAYGAAALLANGPDCLRLATAHSLREMRSSRADAMLLSPVFATRSHLGTRPLGPVRFLLLARQAALPVIALGGMDSARAHRIADYAWAAIDGLSNRPRRRRCTGRSNR